MPEMALGLVALHLEIGDRRVQLRVPVDQPLVAVDQPVLVELDEHLADGGGEPLVHGEALAAPVRRGAERAQLAHDGAAGFRFPLPDALDEFLAPELVSARLLELELALHDHLRGDAGVIGAGLPERIAAAHALVADQDVLQSEGERVPHVQAARHVGRRHHDGVGHRGGIRMALEGARLLPGRIEFRLHLGGIKCLVQHRRALAAAHSRRMGEPGEWRACAPVGRKLPRPEPWRRNQRPRRSRTRR